MVLTKLYTDSCQPCKDMAPVIEKVLKDFPEIEFKEVNARTEEGAAKAAELGVRSVPTLFLNNDYKHSGPMSEPQLRAWLSNYQGA